MKLQQEQVDTVELRTDNSVPSLAEHEVIPAEPTLVSLAQQIVEGRATDNLQFVVVFGVLLALAGLVVYFIAPYLGERGKLLAAAETLNQRLDEIRRTTDAAEKIKTQIAHSDWTIKEHKTLRRVKLEQLIAAAYKLMLATEADAEQLDGDYSTPSREFAVEVRQISKLYFAELDNEAQALVDAHAVLAKWMINGRSKQRQQKLRNDADKLVLEKLEEIPTMTWEGLNADGQRAKYAQGSADLHSLQRTYAAEYPRHYTPLVQAVQRLEARAAAIMAELIVPVV